MKEEIKEKFTKALLSEKYQQSTGQLKEGCNFCALGVLCDLFILENKEWGWKTGENDLENKLIGGMSAHLPGVVVEWSGAESNDLTFQDDGDSRNLPDENDGGVEFEDIASIVDDFWEEM